MCKYVYKCIYVYYVYKCIYIYIIYYVHTTDTRLYRIVTVNVRSGHAANFDRVVKSPHEFIIYKR